MSAPTLLVIDDDRNVCELLSTLAEYVGVNCVSAVDPDASLELVKRHKPDTVLLDLQMPKRDGIEVLRELARIRCEASVIVLSGLDNRTLRSTQVLGERLGLKMGAPLKKPVFLSDLLSRIREVLPASSLGARVAAATQARAA